jgi:tetratricopeptide (TPR) repeat protein
MTSLFDFSQTISKFNKDKKFSETLKYFKENKTEFTNEQIVSNVYLISAMLTALRKTENFDNAFKFLEIYKVVIDKNTKEIVLTAYGWLLYSKFKSENQLNDNHQIESELFDDEEMETTINHQYSKSELIHKIEKYLPLILEVNNDFAYSVVSNLFSSVLKVEKNKPNVNWTLISDFCDLIPYEHLHNDCRTIEVVRKGQKKLMELASDKENWFAYKSKALMKLNMFQECFEVSSQALDLFDVFHYSNDVWFARRVALSKKNLGNVTEAISELEQVLRKKKEWFIQKELASLYKETGDIEKSFNYAISAINNFGDLEYKVDLLYLLGEIFTQKQDDDMAFKHFALSQLIRLNEGWSVPPKLQAALLPFERSALTVYQTQELKSELKKYWNSFKTENNIPRQNTNQRQAGKIDRILHNNENGIDGFIRFDGNKSIYFRVNTTEDILKQISIGLAVNFKVLPATEDKKERAIQLKIQV